MIGVSGGERMYLLSREDVGRTRLIIMNDAGRVVRRRTLQIPETNLVFRRFDVTPEGVLTSLLGFEDRAEIVWWRTDRLLSNQRSAPEDIENER
jgi:hypothetical protein